LQECFFTADQRLARREQARDDGAGKAGTEGDQARRPAGHGELGDEERPASERAHQAFERPAARAGVHRNGVAHPGHLVRLTEHGLAGLENHLQGTVIMSNWLGNDADAKWEMWLYGVIAPLPIIGLASVWIVSRHADLHDKSRMVLTGTDAVALGLTTLCLALALHIHYFWRLSQNPVLNRSYHVGRTLSLVGAMIGLLYVTWCFVRLCIL